VKILNIISYLKTYKIDIYGDLNELNDFSLIDIIESNVNKILDGNQRMNLFESHNIMQFLQIGKGHRTDFVKLTNGRLIIQILKVMDMHLIKLGEKKINTFDMALKNFEPKYKLYDDIK
jgi:hypothetical protein